MSFSASFKASKATGVENIQEIKDKQAAVDAPNPPMIGVGHQQQIALAEDVILKLCDAFPDKQLSGSIYGHANTDGSGNMGVSYSFARPA